jgi:hypothetical protein
MRKLNDGIEFARIALPNYRTQMLLWRFDLSKFQMVIERQSAAGDGRGSDIEGLAKSANAIFAANGGPFDVDSEERLTPSGLLTINHIVIRKIYDGIPIPGNLTGVLFERNGQVAIAPYNKFSPVGVSFAVQAGPRLVEPGGQFGMWRDDHERQDRAAICLIGNASYGRATALVVVVVHGTDAGGGISLYQLADVLMGRDLSCDSAINLDGGPRMQAQYVGEQPIKALDHEPLDNAVVLRRR